MATSELAGPRRTAGAWTASRTVSTGRYRGVRRFETPLDLPPGGADLLLGMLRVQGSCELTSVQLFRGWLDRAPTIEDRWTLARIIADESRHGLEVCRLLHAFGPEGHAAVAELLASPPGDAALGAFAEDLDTWPDVLAFLALIDRVGVHQQDNVADCAYAPLARAMPSMTSEELLHVNYGTAGLKRLAACGPDGAAAAQRAIDRWYPRALAMFGSPSSRRSRLAEELGIKRLGNAEARRRYADDLDVALASIGLRLPAAPPPDPPARNRSARPARTAPRKAPTS